ncbi:MAG: methionyl-tRNA formyltransferase, partial [Gammaproteobacteria bacterium]
MKILFAGTPKTSSVILKNLIDLGHDVIGVITQPDKKRGRRAIESPSPVSEIARSNDIKQYKPTNLNDLEFKNSVSNNEFDVLVVVAYGKILPKWLLDLPNIMPVNIHFSLLPKYRGAS